MPSAVAILLMMGALMVASASAQSYTDEEATTMCASIELQPCRLRIPGAYQLSEKRCVQVFTTEKDFNAARTECKGWRVRGDVAAVLNEEEHKKLLCMTKEASPQRLRYWVGALRERNQFYWTSGVLTYTPWAQPNYSEGEACVQMNTDDDDAQMVELCANMELEECPSDTMCGVYRLNENSCVKLSSMQENFEAAKRLCKFIKGKVVKVENEEEHKKLLCMMYRLYPKPLRYWISSVRRQGSEFRWVDGNGNVTFAPWHSTPPSYGREPDCVWMNSDTWGPWDKGNCRMRQSVACQIPM
uniref:C-type lectin domain-containing protein 161-like isoform X2 n=1 Tax=Doryrhamphus excisus TaxID=161450 RepID=UPI0025AE5614|nr:C-type lectin domain-containing protein 161-like isoform X2 [Doryrhamphus excisus]